MQTKIIPLTLMRGDSRYIGITLKHAESAPEEIYFSVKENKSRRSYLLQKSLGSGIEPDAGAEDMRYIITIDPADTASLAGGRYCYDIEVHINGDTITPVEGDFILTEDVTR